jgi:protease IV
MKGFFKFTLASILGVIIGLLIFILIGVSMIGAASQEKPLEIKKNTVLVASFENPIVDREPESPFNFKIPTSFRPESTMGLDAILENIDKAKDDENISGILLDLTDIPSGIASVEEIRNALLAFKDSGKFIIAHADMYSQKSYYLASVADKVYLTPKGGMMFMGLSSEAVFFKRVLDKLGIEFQVVKYGEYKGATEPLLYEKLSKENREQIQQYINSLWAHYTENISKERNISMEELNRYADEMLITNDESALKYNLVDSLKYFDEVLDELKEMTGTNLDKDLNSVSIAKYTKVPKIREHKGLAKDKIAVIYASGSIVTGDGEDNSIGSDVFAKAIRKVRRDSTVKAIVLRINSGGGSGLASEIIWREVKLAKETKPVVVSMGDVAASGGYYIAAPANKIFAGPNTITGSIGVFGVFPNMQKLFNDKIGITTDVVKTNEHANFGSVFHPLNAKEKLVLQNEIDNFYDGFLKVVSEGRGMTVEEVDKIGRGHVYTGLDAIKIGLIDEIGGLEAATKAAAELAELDNYRIVKYPKMEDPFQKILNQMKGEASVKYAKEALGENYFYLQQIEDLKEIKGVQARLPFILKMD